MSTGVERVSITARRVDWIHVREPGPLAVRTPSYRRIQSHITVNCIRKWVGGELDVARLVSQIQGDGVRVRAGVEDEVVADAAHGYSVIYGAGLDCGQAVAVVNDHVVLDLAQRPAVDCDLGRRLDRVVPHADEATVCRDGNGRATSRKVVEAVPVDLSRGRHAGLNGGPVVVVAISVVPHHDSRGRDDAAVAGGGNRHELVVLDQAAGPGHGYLVGGRPELAIPYGTLDAGHGAVGVPGECVRVELQVLDPDVRARWGDGVDTAHRHLEEWASPGQVSPGRLIPANVGRAAVRPACRGREPPSRDVVRRGHGVRSGPDPHLECGHVADGSAGPAERRQCPAEVSGPARAADGADRPVHRGHAGRGTPGDLVPPGREPGPAGDVDDVAHVARRERADGTGDQRARDGVDGDVGVSVFGRVLLSVVGAGRLDAGRGCGRGYAVRAACHPLHGDDGEVRATGRGAEEGRPRLPVGPGRRRYLDAAGGPGRGDRRLGGQFGVPELVGQLDADVVGVRTDGPGRCEGGQGRGGGGGQIGAATEATPVGVAPARSHFSAHSGGQSHRGLPL